MSISSEDFIHRFAIQLYNTAELSNGRDAVWLVSKGWDEERDGADGGFSMEVEMRRRECCVD